jgi:hypothetical protein
LTGAPAAPTQEMRLLPEPEQDVGVIDIAYAAAALGVFS